MRSNVLSAVMVCVAGVAISAQAPPMRPGQWEGTVQTQMPGAPVQTPETTFSQCVTAEQIKEPPMAALPGCKVSDYKVDGNTVTWKMACIGQPPVSGSGHLTFDGDTYKGSIQMSMPQGEMIMNVAGKRVGECKQ